MAALSVECNAENAEIRHRVTVAYDLLQLFTPQHNLSKLLKGKARNKSLEDADIAKPHNVHGVPLQLVDTLI